MPSKLDYAQERDRELLEAFYRHLGHDGIDQAVSRAILSPCSRYWISPEYAVKRISAIRRGTPYGKRGFRRMRDMMVRDIMRKCCGDYSAGNVERVVFSPAPQFFLTHETAKRYIYYALSKKQNGREKH